MSAFLAAAALGLCVATLAPARAPSLTALAPIRDLPAGHVLRAEDVTELKIPRQHAPDSASVVANVDGAQENVSQKQEAAASGAGPAPPRPGSSAVLSGPEAIGSRLAVPWPAGAPLHTGAFAGSTLLRQVTDGEVAVPLSWEDAAAASLLGAGDLVDVVVSTPRESGEADSQVLASDARVLWVSPGEAEGGAGQGPGGWLGGSGGTGSTVVLALPRSLAAAVSSAPQRGAVSLVLTG